MMRYGYWNNAADGSCMGNFWLGSLVFIVIFIDLVLLGLFLWKQINKK